MDLAGADLYELSKRCTASFASEEVTETRTHACVVRPCADPEEI